MHGGDGECARAVAAVEDPAGDDGTDDGEEGDGPEHEAAAKGGDDGDGDGADEGDHQQLPSEASGRRQRPTDLSEG